tara:strand:- start:1285 stop:1878 length:594 start_codon:yes stop_codon:yes gene_type:complete
MNKNILVPSELKKYILNDFKSDSKMVSKILNKELDNNFINKLSNLINIHLQKYGDNKLYKITKNINKKHNYFFNEAKNEAKKSILNHKHGCVIIFRNEIIARGYNKVINFNNKYKSIHAEMDALTKLSNIPKFNNKNIRRNCILYVVRIQNGSNNLKMSKPCVNCTNNIIKNNIGLTYYSTNNTFIDDLISQYIILL